MFDCAYNYNVPYCVQINTYIKMQIFVIGLFSVHLIIMFRIVQLCQYTFEDADTVVAF